jgi:alkylhydroperoxidase family enzyme
LSDNGLNMDEVLDLMFAASVFSWVNRLSHVLGDPLAQN